MSQPVSTNDYQTHNSSEEDVACQMRFDPKEEAELLRESQEQKAGANKLYASSAFTEAIGEYDKALALCPNYLDYDIAVLKSNIAACHIKLEEWKEAVESATGALDGLERIDPTEVEKSKHVAKEGEASKTSSDTKQKNYIVELDGEEEETERALAALRLSDERRDQVNALRAKSLLRRARGNNEQGGWANLASAEEDYKAALEIGVLPAADQKFVRAQLISLGPRINTAKEKEMSEMMGKLKDIGNGFLKPFGLSTDMFKFEQNDTGGYSMSFDGNSEKN